MVTRFQEQPGGKARWQRGITQRALVFDTRGWSACVDVVECSRFWEQELTSVSARNVKSRREKHRDAYAKDPLLNALFCFHLLPATQKRWPQGCIPSRFLTRFLAAVLPFAKKKKTIVTDDQIFV